MDLKHYRNYTVLLMILLSPVVTNAQDKTEEETKYLMVSVGQGTDNSFTKSESAQMIATFPNDENKEDSYLINGYIDVSLVNDTKLWQFGASAEIQKNTLIDKEQDVRQFGFTFGKTWQDLFDVDNPFGEGKIQESAIDYVMSGSLKYSYDDIKNKGGVQATLGFTAGRIRSKIKDGEDDNLYILNVTERIPRDDNSFSNILQFSHNHNLGLGYIASEDVFLANFDFQFNIYPLSKLLRDEFKQEQLLFVSFNYASRGELIGELESAINPLRTWSYGLEYSINDDSKIQLAYNDIKGANPYKGLDNQDYSNITIKLKFSFDNKE